VRGSHLFMKSGRCLRVNPHWSSETARTTQINPLTPKLNPPVQGQQPEFFLPGI
jgi:hypothetical protein